jgi:carbon storage regulator
MLLITRREDEAIVINGNITVKVLEVRGGRVKLGFEFPPGSTVYRQELFAKIQAENQAAASAAPAVDVLKSLRDRINPPANQPQKQPKDDHDAPSPSPDRNHDD